MHRLCQCLGALCIFITTFLVSAAHARQEQCNTDLTLVQYYIFHACEGGSMTACAELKNYLNPKSVVSQGDISRWLVGTPGKPDYEPDYSKGDFVKYSGPDGKLRVSKIEGTIKPPGSFVRTIGHSPIRGTEEFREDKNVIKISHKEFNSIAAEQILAAMGAVAGTRVMYEVGGVVKEAAIEEVNGAVMDEAKEQLLVRTQDGIKKIPLSSIKSIPLRKISSVGMKAALGVLSSYAKLGSFIGKILGPGVSMFLGVMAPTSVGCAELIATVFSGLDPSCRQSAETSISDLFTALPFEDQRKLIRSNSRLCGELSDYIKKKTIGVGAVDFEHTQLECNRQETKFRSPTSVVPQIISPGHFPGYDYRWETSDIKKYTKVVVEPTNTCVVPSTCIAPNGSQKMEAKFVGSQLVELNINGKVYSQNQEPQVFRSYFKDMFQLFEQMNTLRTQCFKQKNADSNSNVAQ